MRRRVILPRPGRAKISRGTFAGVAHEDFGGMGDFWSDLVSQGTTALQKEATKVISTAPQQLINTLFPQPKPTTTVVNQALPATQIIQMEQAPGFFDKNKTIILVVGGSVAALLLSLIVYKAVKK